MKLQEFPFKNIDEGRKFAIQIRKLLSKEFIKFISQRIQREIIKTEEFQKSEKIACFFGAKGEPDTSLILNQSVGKIFLPKVTSENKMEFFLYSGKFKEGKHGIPEPISDIHLDVENIDLFLVPGVLFDKRGFRVGYGKGYYDRVLEMRKKGTPVFGISWSFQVFEKIPYEKPNDVFVQKIFTEVYLLETSTQNIHFYPPETIS